MPIKSVLFVCLGNICRSPTADGVMRKLAEGKGITIDSCGTAGWHIGKSPDPRAVAEAASKGYDLSLLRARQISQEDFKRFELIIAMDQSNLNNINAIAPCGHSAEVKKFTDLLPDTHPMRDQDVPDPYYEDNFPEVLELIEEGADQLLKRLA